ncbi:hypothetical protein [Sphingomonas melonis]
MSDYILPDAYRRLIEAQRYVSEAERLQIEEDDRRETLAYKIRRRLPKVY